MLYASVDKHKWLPGSDVCFAKHIRHTLNITMRKILEWYVINDVTLYQLYICAYRVNQLHFILLKYVVIHYSTYDSFKWKTKISM